MAVPTYLRHDIIESQHLKDATVEQSRAEAFRFELSVLHTYSSIDRTSERLSNDGTVLRRKYACKFSRVELFSFSVASPMVFSPAASVMWFAGNTHTAKANVHTHIFRMRLKFLSLSLARVRSRFERRTGKRPAKSNLILCKMWIFSLMIPISLAFGKFAARILRRHHQLSDGSLFNLHHHK